MTDPIAYTYEADIHCENCAEARFGRRHGGEIDGTDAEGNRIGAQFDFEGSELPVSCGTCREVIAEDDRADETPEGHTVISRDEDEESIIVESFEGDAFEVRNVAGAGESRDRYEVYVTQNSDAARVFFSNQLKAPAMGGPSWSSDPLGSAADAAISFYAARNDAE